ncbi:ZIP-like iron-zinc transporter [Mycena leptocephala]|nr:ZIP-like iron-zinc transporter [Mycena leptocephala]
MSRLSIALVLLAFIVFTEAETKLKETSGGFMPGPEAPIFASEIQECLPVWRLSLIKTTLEADESPLMRKIFAFLFPFGPAWNSVLGTFYISSIPNFILAFIPAQISPNTLNTMTAFATGGLLSDVFLHLVPHSFMGEHQDPGVHFVMVEEKRNILIGLAIFVGFAAFFMMEKTLRVLGGDEDGAGHGHSHAAEETAVQASGASAKSSEDGLRSRKAGEKVEAEPVEPAKSATGPSKMSAYLNLFGDFVHNMMAASFYASPLIGATTTLACFAHEIPHEIADYSILIRSGFTKKQAMQSQFLTAVGAFVSIPTFIGIAVHTATANDDAGRHSADLAAGVRQDANGLLGTTVQLSDLVIPFVAGGFLYIGAVAVLPTLLAESKSAAQAIREFVAMAVGVLCMFLVAWNE